MNTPRKYYTLCERLPGERWTPEFGDYCRRVVEQERKDCSREIGTEFKIIQTDDNQASINAAVARLNFEVVK